ncbi:hypothetical protein F8154_12785 [Alkaliphilus pronyensis]|uniref:Uncharacterized protein n=1 Tax=Alkaliphilus pronyensis TaxID=1482732 RepID=A0A6I0EYY5_9FIRM|nr:hypothetical protein [Alkaliphilus pronyensis]KAB3531294.1 hypothetical protein F8154_12785 [Alkaliphilus pronyensis]
MKTSKWLALIQIVQLIAFYITITHILPNNEVVAIFIYIVLSILFSITSKDKGFILLVAAMLITGILCFITVFISKEGVSLQRKAILYHLAFIFNTVTIYIFFYLTKELEKDNEILLKTVNELESYVGHSRLLTKHEFERRSNIIKMAMDRRGEEGYILYFSLENISPIVKASLFETLTSLALIVFRWEYDLVGKWNDDSFVLLLQNTDEEGMKTAFSRYLSKIKSKTNLQESDLVIEIEYIGLSDKKVIGT